MASSYAAHSSSVSPYAGHHQQPPLQHRPHWSTILFGSGLAVCAVTLVLTLAGVPGKLGYDAAAPAHRNEPSGSNPLVLARSIDGNIKWVEQHSGTAPDAYLGHLTRLNEKQRALADIAVAIDAMSASVAAIDQNLQSMIASNDTLAANLGSIAATSQSSAATLNHLEAGVGGLTTSIDQLATATEGLAASVRRVNAGAVAIGRDGTRPIHGRAGTINDLLPNEVPSPRREEQR